MSFTQLNKLAFICNLAWIISLVMRYFPVLQGSIAESTILVMGLVLSFVVNAILTFTILVRVLKNQKSANIVTLTNVIVFLGQVILLASGLLNITNS